jgi:AcrR family transcriptional regulator
MSTGTPTTAMSRSGEEQKTAMSRSGEEQTNENRLERRKMRTRAALIRAAQTFIAAGKLNVPVLEITQAADVGMGSFYNHFDSKEQLFQAAINEALDAHATLLDSLTGDHEDPAETFARSFRLTGRLFRRRPELSRVLLNSGLALISSDRGLAPRALRDIDAASRAGRFAVNDPALALAVAGGALLGLGQLLQDQPARDDAAAADRVTEDVLIMFGLAADDAAEVCRRPLPDLDELTTPGSEYAH